MSISSRALCAVAAAVAELRPLSRGQGSLIFIFLFTNAAAAHQTFTTFDPPDSIYTSTRSINDAGFATGFFVDSVYGEHGFVRAPTGEITVFDVPQATQTFATCINNSNEISGDYAFADQHPHGYLRAADGTITKFDPPNAIATWTGCINDSGEIPGGVVLPGSGFKDIGQGFIRAADGSLTLFEVPKSSRGLYAYSINGSGVVAGTAVGGHNLSRAFIRTTDDGSVKLIRGDNWFASSGSAINNSNAMTGYFEYTDQVTHGFLRSAKGKIEQFDPLDSNATSPKWINDRNDVAGYFRDSAGGVRGFLRTASGKLTSFDVPGSQYTTVYGINSGRQTVGEFLGADGNLHGYMRTP